MPTTLFCQLSEGGEIIALFSCPQDESVWPRQAQLTSDDPRYVVYYTAQSDFVRQFLEVPATPSADTSAD